MASLHSDLRFSRIVRRVGLPVQQFAVRELEAEPKLKSPAVESTVNAFGGRQTMIGAADRTIETKSPGALNK